MAGLAQRDARLQEWVARDMLRAGIVALASPAAASHSAEMLSLLRDILLQYLTTSPHPRQVRARYTRIGGSSQICEPGVPTHQQNILDPSFYLFLLAADC